MPLTLGWKEILARLVLAAVAGGLVGYNRGEHGRPAGLRTTLLVCLAAALSMIQMNLLLDVRGKTPDSFVVMDVMRLPLGILSGMGFIGAGAILRRDNIVLGVTTAATLWYVTVMGLCFGGGQLGLGLAALAIALAALWGLKAFENVWRHEHRARLMISSAAESLPEAELTAHLAAAGYKINKWSVVYSDNARMRHIICQVRWEAEPSDVRPPAFVKELAARPHVRVVEWKPAEMPT